MLEEISKIPEKLKYPSLPRYYPTVFDHSTTKLAMECFRKYFYRIILGRVPFKSKYQCIFDFGSAYHKFRELLELAFLAGKPHEICFSEAIKYISEVKLTPGDGKYSFYTKQRLFESCVEAFKYWKEEKRAGKIKVIAVEQPFNIALPDGTFIGGRADQIVEWNGVIWGRDFKTTAKLDSYFTATLDPNDQATRYIYMESKLHLGSAAITNGRFVKGIIFEVLQNTDKKPPRIFPTLVTKNQYQLETWEREQTTIHRLLKVLDAEDNYPMCPTNCSWCDYSKVCKAPSEASQENILRNDFKLSPWNHENVEQVTLSEQ